MECSTVLMYCNVCLLRVYFIIRNVERQYNDTDRLIKSIDTEVTHLSVALCAL